MAIRCPKCQADNPETKQFCGDCGTPLPSTKGHPPVMTETLRAPVQELTTGSTFASRYQVIEELGHGGMGRVYKVLDTKTREKVALKLIKPEIASDKETIERFGNELRLARRIRQKNVCGMYDLGEAEGAHFITMEYVHGEDLKSMIQMSAGLTIGTVLSVGKQVCDGLAEAHSLGVVHRDLKPQNIMIDRGGNAKIMDFGIARSLKEKGLTGASVMIGTPEYMSPEQAEAKEVDLRSDIYSLGIILYEMATGRVPFEGDTALSIAMKHKGEIPKDPKQLNPGIPDDLSAVILKCLAKDREKRYQTAADLRSELDKIERGIPTTERVVPATKPITSREITLKFTPKKFLVPGLALLSLIAIALILWLALPSRRPVLMPSVSGKPSLAIVYFENVSGDKTLEPWKTELTELLITKLSQSKYINVLSSDRIFSLLKKLNLQDAKKYSTEDLVRVANEGGATYTLSGSLMKAGKNIIMNLTLQKPRTGEIISPLNIECSGEEEIFPRVDELAKTIKSDMNLTADQIATDIDKEVGKITTTSPEAYQYYSEGRRKRLNGEDRESIKPMEKAIAIDPRFAMAYRNLAMAYSDLGYYSEFKENLQKAFNYSDRVSDRERYIIQGDYYRQSEKTLDKAIEVYDKLLSLYPDDTFGNGNSALVYEALEEWDKAIERGEAAIKYEIRDKIESIFEFMNEPPRYMAKGQYDKAVEAPELFISTFGDNFNMRWELGLINFCQGKYSPALLEVEKAFTLHPNDNDSVVLRGYIYLCQGDLNAAEKDFEKLLSVDEKTYHLGGRFDLGLLYALQGKFEKARNQFEQGANEAKDLKAWDSLANFHFWLSYIQERLGNYDVALKECDKLWAIAAEQEFPAYQRLCLFMRAATFVEMNQIDKARQAATEIKSMIDKQMDKKLIRLWHYLMGMIELRNNHFSQAIGYFNNGISLMPFQNGLWGEQGYWLDCLAQTYFKSGDLDKARQTYEKITPLTSGRTQFGDIYAKAFYMLGRIAEQLGDKGKARENYQKFLDLWKDADPGLPEVPDAKARLAGLKGI